MADLLVAELEVVDGPDENELLADAAGRVRLKTPSLDEDLDEALEEGAAGKIAAAIRSVWKPDLHPRWPSGTAGGKGGEFIHVGERFMRNGHEYEVAHVTNKGQVIAHESSGKVGAAETIEIDPKTIGGTPTIPDIAPAPPKAIYAETKSKTNIVIVNPYVEPSTHDPSIPVPAGSKISAEQWKRFGKIDQEHYATLMEKHGAYSGKAAQSKHDALYHKYSAAAQASVKTAYGGQYGGSSGHTLSLTPIFNAVTSSGGALNTAQEHYAEAKELMRELGEVAQWDLYNRTQSPDLAIFHKGDQSPAQYEKKYIHGDEAIQSGYSQSFKFAINNQHGANTIATPVAIRHVQMATHSAHPVPGEKHYAGGTGGTDEAEISVPERLELDDRSITFVTHGIGPQAATWLGGVTDKPAGGEIIEMMKANLEGHGTLPIPPPPIEITYLGTDKQWLEPPPDAGAIAHSLAKTDGTLQSATAMGLVAGDFMEGKKGTRYLVIADPSDTYGLRYVKVEQGGTLNLQKSYRIDQSDNEFYKLDGHVDLPKPKAEAGFTPFTGEQYAALAHGTEKLLSKYAVGEMFKHDNEGWKVTKAGPVPVIQSLDNGKSATANGDHPAVELVPKDASAPSVPASPAENAPAPYTPSTGDTVLVASPGLAPYVGTVTDFEVPEPDGKWIFVLGPNGQKNLRLLEYVSPFTAAAPEKPEAGDIFHAPDADGQPTKWTVTSVLKNGTVRAKPAGGGKGSKFPADDPALTTIFRLGDYEVGEKKKAGQLAPGDLISGSPAKVRPYVVLGQQGGKVYMRNLETGEVIAGTKQKSWAVLKTKPGPDDASPDPPDTKAATTSVPDAPVPLKLTGVSKTIGELEPGDTFTFGSGAEKFLFVTKGGPLEKAHAKSLDGGTDLWYDFDSAPNLAVPVQMLGPDPAEPSTFDKSNFAPGMKVPLNDMEVGQVVEAPTGGAFKVVAKDPGGIVITVNLATGARVPFLAVDEFKVLHPKDEVEVPYEQLTKGDHVELGKLNPGDTFKMGGQMFAAAGPISDDPASNVMIATETMGQFNNAGSISPNTPVTLHEKKPTELPPSVPPVDPAELPDALEAGGMKPYLHPKSGTAKYDKIGHMVVGTHFKDKSGQTWIVKSSGAHAIVSNGETNFSVDGGQRGKALEETTKVDHAGAVGSGEDWQQQAQQADLVVAQLPLAQYSLQVGDHFVGSDGTTYEVQEQVKGAGTNEPSGGVFAQNTKTGNSKFFGSGYYPTWVPPGKEKLSEQPDETPLVPKAESPSFREIDLGSFDPGAWENSGAKMNHAMMPVGTVWTNGPGDEFFQKISDTHSKPLAGVHLADAFAPPGHEWSVFTPVAEPEPAEFNLGDYISLGEPGIPLADLKPGDVFTKTPDGLFEYTKIAKTDDEGQLWATSNQTGEEVYFPAHFKATPVTPAEQPGDVATWVGKAGSEAGMAVGDTYYLSGSQPVTIEPLGAWDDDGVYVRIDMDGISGAEQPKNLLAEPPKAKGPPLPEVGSKVKLKNGTIVGEVASTHKDAGGGMVKIKYSDGSTNTWSADKLEVIAGPEVPPTPKFTPEVGQNVTLTPGTLYKTDPNEQFKVLARWPDGKFLLDNNLGSSVNVEPGSITGVVTDPGPVPAPGLAGGLVAGQQVTVMGGAFEFPEVGWTGQVVGPAPVGGWIVVKHPGGEEGHYPAGQLKGTAAEPLVPYLHHKAGTGKKNAHLASLKAGVQFTDKSKAVYTKLGGDVYADAAGNQFVAGDPKAWVKVIPPVVPDMTAAEKELAGYGNPPTYKLNGYASGYDENGNWSHPAVEDLMPGEPFTLPDGESYVVVMGAPDADRVIATNSATHQHFAFYPSIRVKPQG